MLTLALFMHFRNEREMQFVSATGVGQAALLFLPFIFGEGRNVSAGYEVKTIREIKLEKKKKKQTDKKKKKKRALLDSPNLDRGGGEGGTEAKEEGSGRITRQGD